MLPLHVTVTDDMPAEKTGAPFLASFAEVEVDPETGNVDILRLVVVHDAGTVMFPSGAEAQQIGAQVQAIGETLYEEIVYDDASGRPLSFDWIDYTMPTMLDMPPVEPVLLEVWRGAGEYGACGIGESAITCTPRAILNAIYNATGVRINEIPAKPEKVLDALARRAEGRQSVDEELSVAIRRRLDAADALSEAAATTRRNLRSRGGAGAGGPPPVTATQTSGARTTGPAGAAGVGGFSHRGASPWPRPRSSSATPPATPGPSPAAPTSSGSSRTVSTRRAGDACRPEDHTRAGRRRGTRRRAGDREPRAPERSRARAARPRAVSGARPGCPRDRLPAVAQHGHRGRQHRPGAALLVLPRP